MTTVVREPVKGHRTGVYVMAQLLSDIGCMGLLVTFVSAAAVIGGVVVFHQYLAVHRGLEEQPCARGGTP